MKIWSWLLLATVIVGCPAIAQAADSYPSDTFHFILPNAPGGSAEATARILGDGLTALTHQAAIVEPRPGAAGNLAAAYAAKAKPDGYTIFMGFQGTHGVNANAYRHLEYDPLGDFKAVSMAWKTPFYLYTKADAPFHSVKELVAYAKANPGKLNFGNGGKTDPSNIAMLLFNNLAGVDIQGVPYKSIADAIQDVAAGRIDGAFATGATGFQFVQAGQARLIGMSFEKPTADHPDIPAVSDTVPGFLFISWDGALVPAKTPPDRIATLNGLIRKALTDPDIQARFKKLGLDADPTSPEEMSDFIKSDTARIGKAMKAAGMEPE